MNLKSQQPEFDALRAKSNAPEVFINGRFLSQALTGVQRYSAELVKAADELIAAGDVPSALLGARFTLLAPPDAITSLPLKRIVTRQVGTRRGHTWDQIDLAWAARGGMLLSLANSGPVLHRQHLVVLHDAQAYRHPEFFSRSYLLVHRTLGRLFARTAQLATVSVFSRSELAWALGVAEESIAIIPNSAEHIRRIVPDETILTRLGLTQGHFFLALGTMSRNKNFALAIEASRLLRRPDYPLVVVGGGNQHVFGGDGFQTSDGIMAGRLSDEEIAALYKHATAFIFPSIYEGFGVPLLEAMSFGCAVIASNARAVVETCGDAAAYFDPMDARALAQLMEQRIAGEPPISQLLVRQERRLALYSWKRSARKLLDIIAR